MSVKSTFVVLLVVFVTAAAAQEFAGPQWQNKTANSKRETLWKTVKEEPTPGAYPGILSKLELFVEVMNMSFDSAFDDFMPNKISIWPHTTGHLREKLIHSQGVHALCSWQSVGNHNYTGLFKGAKYGIIRLSSAKKPEPTSNPPSLAPGVGFKFLRSGIPSTNIIAMYQLAGQESFNFFEHDITNHVPDLGLDAGFALKKVRQVFSRASAWPVMLGVSDFAMYSQEGVKVAKPQFPFRLVFHPTSAMHRRFSNTEPSDTVLEDLAAGLASGKPVYEIYAQATPYSDDLTRIGTINLESSATMSVFGDKKMFLQHVRMEDDLALRPDWVKGTQAITDYQQNLEQQFEFPDLPFN